MDAVSIDTTHGHWAWVQVQTQGSRHNSKQGLVEGARSTGDPNLRSVSTLPLTCVFTTPKDSKQCEMHANLRHS